jgi:outer membrane lipoprotein-sorting protein
MRRINLGVGVALLLLGSVLQAWAFELSADMVARDGEQKQSAKLYVKGNKYRIETKNGSEYAIIRHDKNKSWIVIPDQKAYIEMPFDPKKKPAIEERQSADGNRKFLGAETINGHLAKKYEVTAREGEPSDSFYEWIAADINFPIKTMAVNGNWSVEYSNIKTSVPDSLFEIPEAYERIAMPASVGQIGSAR